MGADVPATWSQTSLGAVAEVISGQAPPGRTVKAWDGTPQETGLPFIQGNAEFGLRHPMPTKWCAEPVRQAEVGDVLLSVRAPVGATSRAHTQLAIGRGIAAIRFHQVDPTFGWHALNHAKHAFERLVQGSTFDAIGGQTIRELQLVVPPFSEQRLIATILDSIDEAIERAEAVISASGALREALVRELCMRGLPGNHTKWRNVPGLGTIPACWDVTTLGGICEVASGFAMGPERAPRDHARPYLTVANVHTDRVTVEPLRHMELTDAELASRSLRPGDLVLVEGHAQVSQLGRAAIVPPAADGFAFQNHLFRIRPVGSDDARFICAFINGPQGRAYFASFGGTTSGLNTVSAVHVRRLPLPRPPIAEQRVIATILSTVTSSVAIYQDNLTAQRRAKDSLAEHLLTGRARVGTSTTRVIA